MRAVISTTSYKTRFKYYFKTVLLMTEKITLLKLDPELWRKVKLLAIKRGVTLKSLIEELLALEVEGEEFFEGEIRTSKNC